MSGARPYPDPEAKAAGKDVYISEGSYEESLELETDVSVYGGYAHGFATRHDSAATQVLGGETAALADGDERVLLTITGGFMPDGSGLGSYALRVIDDASGVLDASDGCLAEHDHDPQGQVAGDETA